MPKHFFGFWLLAGLAGLSGGWAQAQEESLFERLDKNKDGFLAGDEIESERKPLFERLLRTSDKNADGKLDREEFAAATKPPERPVAEAKDSDRPRAEQPRSPRPQPAAEDGSEFFKRLDRNSDGKLQKEELPERMRALFDRIDGNQDGAVDSREFAEVARRLGGGAAGLPGPMPNAASFAGPLFTALDTDRDGELSAEEIANSAKSLAALDKNQDGKITRDELGPPPGLAGPEAMLRRFKSADANGDGKLSKEEAPDRLKENFDNVDRNGDGYLDEAELREMLQRITGRRP